MFACLFKTVQLIIPSISISKRLFAVNFFGRSEKEEKRERTPYIACVATAFDHERTTSTKQTKPKNKTESDLSFSVPQVFFVIHHPSRFLIHHVPNTCKSIYLALSFVVSHGRRQKQRPCCGCWRLRRVQGCAILDDVTLFTVSVCVISQTHVHNFFHAFCFLLLLLLLLFPAFSLVDSNGETVW